MSFDLGNLPKEKQRFVVIGLVVVIVAVAGFFLYNTFAGGSSGDQAAQMAAPDPNAAAGTGAPPGGVGAPPGGVGAPPGGVGAPPAGDPAAGAAPSAPAAQPAPSATTSAPAAAPSQPAAPTKPSVPGAPKTITVFGSVTVTYPSGWGVGLGSSNSAVISDGRAKFEVHAPDPKASDAKTIASKAVTSVTGKAPGSVPQGALKIAGHDAYYYMVGGKRIVGIDAPTRIFLVEYTKGAPFAAYAAAFDKMQSDLKFR